jgi:hypothetical protein
MIDILVVNRNTLPFLRLLVAQAHRLKPKTPFSIYVWDNVSNDGTREWLTPALNDGLIAGYKGGYRPEGSHTEGLNNLLAVTKSPFVCFMDVDSVPVRGGWLDDAIDLFRYTEIGAVGLSQKAQTPQYQGDNTRRDGFRSYVHPSFCVVKRETLEKHNLSPGAIVGNASGFYDVCEWMCKRIEEVGLRLFYTGKAFAVPEDIGCRNQKVLHLYGSTQTLANPWMPVTTEQRMSMCQQAIARHKALLDREGLWNEFLGYVRESLKYNPLCARYLS